MIPHAILPALVAADAAAPRVTYYDDEPGPTQGERIELSARVLQNWVAKAGNLLQDELDVTAGSVVALDLPAEHWRTLYWALAAWSVGAVVADAAAADDADVLVTTTPQDGHPAQVVVTLAALARSHDGPLPAGAVDEAAELSTYADVLTPYSSAGANDEALRTTAGATVGADLVRSVDEAAPRWLVRGDLDRVLRDALAAWGAGGSVLLSRGTPQTDLDRRLSVEGATLPTG